MVVESRGVVDPQNPSGYAPAPLFAKQIFKIDREIF
jgi:hypothetical protein